MSRPRAADDFATIRARMDELRRDREAGATGLDRRADQSTERAETDSERRRREHIEGYPPPWVPTIFVRNPPA